MIFGAVTRTVLKMPTRTWQRLVESGVVTSVQLVHDHFPHRVASAGTVLSVTVALVRHSEEQRVRPDGHSAEGSCNGSVVHEELVFHHLELFVATDPQVRRADADDRTVGNVCESVEKYVSWFHVIYKGWEGRITSPALSVVTSPWWAGPPPSRPTNRRTILRSSISGRLCASTKTRRFRVLCGAVLAQKRSLCTCATRRTFLWWNNRWGSYGWLVYCWKSLRTSPCCPRWRHRWM